MNEILKILSLVLISSIKFAVGPPLAYLNEKYNFSWLETNLYSILGGMIGVVVFMHFSQWIVELWHRIKHYFANRNQRRNQVFSQPVADIDTKVEIHYQYVEHVPPSRKIFTPRTRKMVRIWRKYGLIGMAALTPMLFSIPVGTFFMSRMEKNKRKILLYMFISVTSWSLILTSLFELLHVRSLHEIIP